MIAAKHTNNIVRCASLNAILLYDGLRAATDQQQNPLQELLLLPATTINLWNVSRIGRPRVSKSFASLLQS